MCAGAPSGGEYIGIGVQSDILVRPTIEVNRNGVDPVLERGLEELRQSNSRALWTLASPAVLLSCCQDSPVETAV